MFMKFDELAEIYGVEKIKTLGDCYMACAGVPDPLADHALLLCRMSLDMSAVMRTLQEPYPLSIRIGIHTGTVVGGVIGVKKFKYGAPFCPLSKFPNS